MGKNDPLLSVKVAQQRLLNEFSLQAVEVIPLIEAGGRILAEAVASPIDLPPFPNSSMDGFALRARDVTQASESSPIILQVVADIPAGQVTEAVINQNQAARIMTGASLPIGADAVVPVELTDFNSRQAGVPAPPRVEVLAPVKTGENVRPKGQDVYAGEIVLSPGRSLRPQDLGFLSMLGVSRIPVYRKPRIGIFSSGDELVPVDQPLTPGKIHDANTYTIMGLIEAAGGLAINYGVVADHPEDVRACFEKAVADRVDLIVSSAGVSVGAFDFVRNVVEEHGKLNFWRVNMRPGKPLAFGHFKGIPFIGLPGNPVSAFVGFEVFVRPAILKMCGINAWERIPQKARLLEAVESDGRESYLRAVVSSGDGVLEARLTGHQGSGNLRSLVQANALLLVPSEVKFLPIGAEVDIWPLGEFTD